jgi:hypothetical protein
MICVVISETKFYGNSTSRPRELLRHANIAQTETYVYTSKETLRDAVRKRDKIDYNAELEKTFEAVISSNLKQQEFTSKLRTYLSFLDLRF